MVARNVEIDTITYNSAIRACAKGAQVETALGLLAEVAHQNMDMDIITYNSQFLGGCSRRSCCDAGEFCITLHDEGLGVLWSLAPCCS